MNLDALAAALRSSRGFVHKRDISDVATALAGSLSGGGGGAMATAVATAVATEVATKVAWGDDCAAIATDDGYLLLAIEGLVDEFVQHMPWFAGYCGVMVNVSDIYAMGGRPLAVVDALWSRGMDPAADVLDGMARASARYGVPIVGGHSNNRSERPQLAVAILGRATKLLTSFDARPGDRLLMAVDLRGAWQEPYPYWNASTEAPASRLRADLEVLSELAESGLCDAAKDISMAGALGTTLMLLECSGVGAEVDLEALPAPAGTHGDDAALQRWLTAFPSYGFILSVRPSRVDQVLQRFAARDIACAPIGEVTAARALALKRGGERSVLWNLAEHPFIGARAAREAHHA